MKPRLSIVDMNYEGRRKLKKITLLIAGIFILSGCGPDYTSQVKDGVFNDHKQTTVGRAFDAWQQCDMGVTWDTFETDSGINIVEYTCSILGTKQEFAKKTLKTWMDNGIDAEQADENLKPLCGFDETCNLTGDRYLRTLATPIEIVFQFTINLDSSFDTTYVGSRLGELDQDLSTLGTPADFVEIVMTNDEFSDITMDRINTSIAMYAADEDLVSESKAETFFGI